MELFCEGRTFSLDAGSTPADLWWRLHGGKRTENAMLAKCGGEVLDFLTPFPAEGGEVSFLPLSSHDGQLAAQRTAVLLLLLGVKAVFGAEADVEVKHSLAGALYCEFADGHSPLSEEIGRISKKMRELRAERPPIVRRVITCAEAVDFLRRRGEPEEAELLLERGFSELGIYECRGLTDYFFGPMLPDLGEVPEFALVPYAPGFLLRLAEGGERTLSPYHEEPLFAKVFLEAQEWGEIIGCRHVQELNRAIREGRAAELVALAEAKQEKNLARLADRICGERPRIRLVCIAGPSSAGKTTFMNRLLTHLRVNGARPVMVSLDDFYRERHAERPGEKVNYENLSALDVELFQKLMARLLEGRAVRLPRFDFKTGGRTWSEEVWLAEGQPVLVEGLHALNPVLSDFVPGYQCLHIYLGALTQLSINRHNRISTTDTRLLRRMVRDARTRGNSAEKTLSGWGTVRRGEKENIFLFQGRAEEIFNTALIYELPVLKRQALPLLSAIAKESPAYAEARRLLTFLMPFEELSPEVVPEQSILREFIGK